MVKKRGVEVALGVSFAMILVLAVSLATITLKTAETDSSDTVLKYTSQVCVYKNGVKVQCDHNVLYDSGRNYTRDALGNSLYSGAFQNISLCNASAACGTPVASATESFTPYTSCGLGSQAGTYAALQGSPGNWTITKTFTSTCDNVNTTATRLSNATGSLFAGNSFTTVTLQTNDQLTINWTLMIS